MNRLLLTASLSAFSIAAMSMGCSKPANQTTSTDTVPASPSGSSTSSSAARKKEAEPRPIVVPADTVISVVLDESLGSKISSTGQRFTATVESPVEVDGHTAIPKHARVEGKVKEAKAAGRFKGGAVLELTLTSVTVNEKDYPMQTNAPVETRKGKGKRTAVLVGGGAGGGAAIGAAAGGGKGAGIGALIGAAAGAGGAGLTGNRDITLPAETALSFKLTQPLEVRPK